MTADGPRVLDLSSGLAGAYASLLFTWAGADVVRAEPAGGDPMRRRSSADDTDTGTEADTGTADEAANAALYEYLRQGQRAVRLTDDAVTALAATGADVVVATPRPHERDGLRAALQGSPDLVVVSITPWGLDGPYRDRPATDFTVQADSGAIAIRGRPDRPPYQLGGRTCQWLAGAYGAAGGMALWHGRAHRCRGGLVDVSVAEVANTGASNFMDVFQALGSDPDGEPKGPARVLETPSIERTADGWVGFNTNAPHQIDAFVRMIGRPDLADSGEFRMPADRIVRGAEWNAMVTAWTTAHTTAEIVELAVAHKVPVAPVCDGRTVTQLDQVVARHMVVEHPDRRFTMPGRPWRIDGDAGPAPRPGPGVPDARVARIAWRAGDAGPPPGTGRRLPLEGLLVVDFTTWWAGPMSTGLLAALGADVIHLESPAHMDGARMVGATFFSRPSWWELSPFFLVSNTNKRALALDLRSDRGRALVLDLVRRADAVVENATPHVLDSLGLGWETLHGANPRTVLVRMPAFGLDGPWRERPGFAQNIEQASGLAWVTGERDDQPRIQRGPCDPNGGVHAVMALLVALARRDDTGSGSVVEAALFDAALAVAAEPIIEWSAYGDLIERDGNRSPEAAPQGLYACAGEDRWLAVSVETDEQWSRLCAVMARPDLGADPALARRLGRRAAHDDLDAAIGAWAGGRVVDEAVEDLVAAGVPAAVVRDPRAIARHPQFAARGYLETLDHPVAGAIPVPTPPFRLGEAQRWLRAPAPTFGQHNREVLGGLLGLTDAEVDALAADGVVAERPLGL